MNQAINSAEILGHTYVGSEHLLLGLIEKADGDVKKLFSAYAVTKERFLQSLATVRGGQRVTNQNPEDTYDVLNKYGTELVEKARAHKIDPVIGRDEEIRNVMRILSRKRASITRSIAAPLTSSSCTNTASGSCSA